MRLRDATPRIRRYSHPYDGILVTVLLLVSWSLLSHTGLFSKTLLAGPGEVWHRLCTSLAPDAPVSTRISWHVYHTIRRALTGWGIGLAIGTALGALLGSVSRVFQGIEPALEFFRAIPPVLAFPLLLVGFDYDERAYVWTIVFGCAPIVVLTVARGTLAVSRDRMDMLTCFGVSALVRGFAVIMEIVPNVFLGARVTLSLSIVVAVVTEMVFTPRSDAALGALARDAEVSFDTPMFFLCVIVIGLFGFLANLLMQKFEERLGLASRR